MKYFLELSCAFVSLQLVAQIKAVDMLTRNLKADELPYENIQLKTELIVGQSCGEK